MPAMIPVECPAAVVRLQGRLESGVGHAGREGDVEEGRRLRGDLEFQAGAPGVRHVEDDPRRARTGRHRCLQISDVHVEAGDVHRPTAFQDGGLGAHFVIPERFIVPGGAVTKGLQIPRRAERRIERVVNAAEAEALRHLRVHLRRLGHGVAGDDPRSNASCRRRPFAVERIGKQAVERLGAPLVEVVPAETAGQAEPVGDGQRDLPEQCELIEVVGEIGGKRVLPCRGGPPGSVSPPRRDPGSPSRPARNRRPRRC